MTPLPVLVSMAETTPVSPCTRHSIVVSILHCVSMHQTCSIGSFYHHILLFINRIFNFHQAYLKFHLLRYAQSTHSPLNGLVLLFLHVCLLLVLLWLFSITFEDIYAIACTFPLQAILSISPPHISTWSLVHFVIFRLLFWTVLPANLCDCWYVLLFVISWQHLQYSYFITLPFPQFACSLLLFLLFKP